MNWRHRDPQLSMGAASGATPTPPALLRHGLRRAIARLQRAHRRPPRASVSHCGQLGHFIVSCPSWPKDSAHPRTHVCWRAPRPALHNHLSTHLLANHLSEEPDQLIKWLQSCVCCLVVIKIYSHMALCGMVWNPFSSRTHSDKIHPHLIPILCSPWLATHNPQTDWASGTLTVWSVRHTCCLRSQNCCSVILK